MWFIWREFCKNISCTQTTASILNSYQRKYFCYELSIINKLLRCTQLRIISTLSKWIGTVNKKSFRYVHILNGWKMCNRITISLLLKDIGRFTSQMVFAARQVGIYSITKLDMFFVNWNKYCNTNIIEKVSAI